MKIAQESIIPIDLHFMGRQNAIAAYLLPHQHGAVLVECGPGSTISSLVQGISIHGFLPPDITDVFVTHIHLDHAGAAGWWARQGARIHVHPAGAPHLLDPEKLISSARRIYGDMMDSMWGEFLPVPPEQLSIMNDGESVEIDGLQIRAIETLGHANHHFVYLCAGTCFSGDIGGVRMPGVRYLRLPVPPPEFHLEMWRDSQAILQKEYLTGTFQRIAPTHFSLFDDADWHLAELKHTLEDLDTWISQVMPSGLETDQLNQVFLNWNQTRASDRGIDAEILQTYEIANPSWMAAAGIQRYWQKHRVNAG